MAESERVGVGVWKTLSVQHLTALPDLCGKAETQPSKGSCEMKTMS